MTTLRSAHLFKSHPKARYAILWAALAAVSSAPLAATPSLTEMELRRLAGSGDLDAQERLGIALAWGRGIERNTEEARRLLIAPAKAGRSIAQLTFLHVTSSSAPEHELVEAFSVAQSLANKGFVGGEVAVGFAYLYGFGAPKRDTQEAIPWLRAAAAQDDPTALTLLARIYAGGWNVAPNAELSIEYAERAAQLQSTESQVLAARLLRRRGSQGDEEMAQALLETAANGKASNPFRRAARFDLGLKYFLGKPQDRKGPEAVKWFKAAAEDNDGAARLMLAECQKQGFGLTADSQQAEKSFTAALSAASKGEANDVAWLLATHTNDDIRDSVSALRIIQHVLQDPKNRNDRFLDTLAAAYAANGQFELAVKSQTEAIDAIPKTADPGRKQSFKDRLELYKQSRAFRGGV